MSDLKQLPDVAWDRLFEFLQPNVSEMTDGEVRVELKKAHIDISPVVRRVQQAIEAKKARACYESARQVRQNVLIRLKEIGPYTSASAQDRIAKVREALQHQYANAAYKLEHSLSDKDLESILTDLERLDEMERLQDHGV